MPPLHMLPNLEGVCIIAGEADRAISMALDIAVHVQETCRSHEGDAQVSQGVAAHAEERVVAMEARLQAAEADAAGAQQQLAQRISIGQAELAALTERAGLQAGLAEVSNARLPASDLD